MATKCRRREAGIILKAGKATVVIQDIDIYQDMFERLEDPDDLLILMELRQKLLKFVRFEDFLDSIEFSRTIN